jgi:hypothetical protein
MELQTNLLAAYASAGRARDVDEVSIPVSLTPVRILVVVRLTHQSHE